MRIKLEYSTGNFKEGFDESFRDDSPEEFDKMSRDYLNERLPYSLGTRKTEIVGHYYNDGVINVILDLNEPDEQVKMALSEITDPNILSLETPEGPFQLQYPAYKLTLPEKVDNIKALTYEINPYYDVDTSRKEVIVHPDAVNQVLSVLNNHNSFAKKGIKIEETTIPVGAVSYAKDCREARNETDSALLLWDANEKELQIIDTRGIISIKYYEAYSHYTDKFGPYVEEFEDLPTGVFMLDKFTIDSGGDGYHTDYYEDYEGDVRPATLEDLKLFGFDIESLQEALLSGYGLEKNTVYDIVRNIGNNEPKP